MLRKSSPPTMCHMSGVTRDMSGVRCHVSGVTCHFLLFFFLEKKVDKLVVGGSVINVAYIPCLV